MSATDTAKEIIRMASTAGLSKDVIDLMTTKMDFLTSENTELKTKVGALEIEVRQLRGQLANSQPIQKPADICPYCRRTAGEVQKITPHMYLGAAGVKVYHYKCIACGKEYEKDDA